jgi:NitT/TauT family transport system ATP-binding protein
VPQNSAPTNALRDRTRTSFVFITHDIEEAVYLGDRVAVLNGSPGRIEDVISIALPNPRDQIVTRALPELSLPAAQGDRSCLVAG